MDAKLSDTFTEIADAIRSKGIKGKMTPLQMARNISQIPGDILQHREAVSGTSINLIEYRTLYTKDISTNTTLSIANPPAEWDGNTITFELEMNVKNNNLTIGYPWTWIDDFLAPDLSKAGCYTVAVRGNKRNGTWKWRANLQDTEPAF